MPLAAGVWLELSCAPTTPPSIPYPSPAHPLSFFFCLQTYIGNVLISVNPYQQLPIYGLEFIAKYRDYTFYELKPHM